MASVGAVSCDYVQGRAPGSQYAVEFATRAGLDGVDARTMGHRAGPFRFIARLIDTGANVETWIGQLEALAGTSQTITVDDGTPFTNCIIGTKDGPGVVVIRKQACMLGAGSAGFICDVGISGIRTV